MCSRQAVPPIGATSWTRRTRSRRSTDGCLTTGSSVTSPTTFTGASTLEQYVFASNPRNLRKKVSVPSFVYSVDKRIALFSQIPSLVLSPAP
ncbi:hypothetical protein TNIN_256081 [Trichonephila inaurata madagascariensis]|uniref:Uncharacterized protein n=1 Tax=Trichonephila inaurata madagascariensis TaxID=2747483 RepID=A0A8X6JFL3_9ARAC|nr:hypothetical protein TNIN_256081 [Trichonephila inaurata madagascariensis]